MVRKILKVIGVVTCLLIVVLVGAELLRSQDGTSPERAPLAAVPATLCQAASETPAENVLALAVLSIAEPEAQALILDSGVSWIRVEFRWDHIEPHSGNLQWDTADAVVRFLTDNDINIIATINHPPVWAHADAQTLASGTANFVRQFAERYGTHIDYYEIFNEPNLPGYGWPFGGDDAAYDAHLYAHVLVAANQAIRDTDSDAFILLAGLSPSGTDPRDWTTALYEHITPACYDIFAYHPYGAGDRLVAEQADWETFIATLDPTGKPVWFGEFGISDDAARVDLLTTIEPQLPEVTALVWFSLRDLKPRGWNFGLVEYDWSKKPAYEQFKEIVRNHSTEY